MILLKLVACTIFAISVESQHNERWNPSGEFPFYVLIKQGDMFWCSGSLIRTQWVITSWHCAETLKIDESTTVESFDQVKNVALKRQIEVEAWFWNHETPYLLKLAEPFEITSKTGVIALSSRRISDFQVVKVVGDGDLTNLKFDYFIQVRTTWDKKMKQMPLSPGKDCYSSLGAPVINVNGNMLYGLGFNHQSRLCRLGVQSVFDDITKYSSWINNTVDVEVVPENISAFPDIN